MDSGSRVRAQGAFHDVLEKRGLIVSPSDSILSPINFV